MTNPEATAANQGVEQHHRLMMAAGVGAVGTAAGMYALHKRPLEKSLQEASLLPFAEDISANIDPRFTAIVVGGFGIDVFNHDGTLVDPTGKEMTAADDFETKLFRRNKTVRDWDVYVYFINNDGKLERVSNEDQDIIQTSIGRAVMERATILQLPAPEISVCSFDDEKRAFYSSTMIDEESNPYLVHGFVTQPLPEDAMSTWTLNLPQEISLNVLNPWEQYWRSMIRYCSGIKPKDVEKLAKMVEKLHNTAGMAEQADGDISKAYSSFYDRMMEQNRYSTALKALVAPTHANEAITTLGLAAASDLMTFGQKFEFVQAFVQAHPEIFNRFGGTRQSNKVTLQQTPNKH